MKDHTSETGKITSGQHISYWLESVAPPVDSGALKEDLDTDVVIVGGGLAGLSVAYCLTQAGRKVVVIEDGLIGSGETGRTTAHLVTALDNRYYELENTFGEYETKLIADSHKAAIDFVEQTVKRENIDCDFERVNGYLFLHPTDQPDSLKREFAAAKRAGVDVKELSYIPAVTNAEPSLQFSDQAQFHPVKYLKGLCKAIEARGGKIYTETHASEINYSGITTEDGFKVKAKHVVIATNSPVNNKYKTNLKQFPYRTYVIGALVKKAILPKALWWDTGDFKINPDIPPYHYVRIHEYNDEYDLLISGGEDHRNTDPGKENVPEEHRYELVEAWTRKHFPIEEIVYRWSGQIIEPMDGIAYIGRNPFDKDNVYIITGDSGNGMTHCTIGGILITDLIIGKDNPWENIYKPSRFTLKASKPFFKEVIAVLMATLNREPKHKDNVLLSSIQRGEGKIVELENWKCGVYRDEEDALHVVSSECTHLQCTIKWNNDEKTWDCPCHGSRFSYDGTVINGPANADLPAYSEKEILKEY